MAEKGSSDARLHSSHGAKLASHAEMIDLTSTVVQKHDARLESLEARMSQAERDIKVGKRSWMREQAKKP